MPAFRFTFAFNSFFYCFFVSKLKKLFEKAAKHLLLSIALHLCIHKDHLNTCMFMYKLCMYKDPSGRDLCNHVSLKTAFVVF